VAVTLNDLVVPNARTVRLIATWKKTSTYSPGPGFRCTECMFHRLQPHIAVGARPLEPGEGIVTGQFRRGDPDLNHVLIRAMGSPLGSSLSGSLLSMPICSHDRISTFRDGAAITRQRRRP